MGFRVVFDSSFVTFYNVFCAVTFLSVFPLVKIDLRAALCYPLNIQTDIVKSVREGVPFVATIKEIATLAGVSRGTVDRVLNHRGSVNPQTEQKILDIIQALDYKPNKAGIVLAAQKKNLKLGVILFGLGNPFYDDVLSGIREKAAELERPLPRSTSLAV